MDFGKDSKFKKVFFGVFGILIICTVLYHSFSSLFNPYETQEAVEMTVKKAVSADCLFVRKESVIKSDLAGFKVYRVSNGGKVAKNSDVISYYNKANDVAVANEINSLDDYLSQIEEIDKQNSTITVIFDDKTAIFTGEEIDDITLAYAITVHKSQGSEFDCVILPVCDLPPQLKYRNLLYTAVTRAKKMLIIVGKGADIKEMIDNDKKTLRYTAFRQFLNGQITFNGAF